MVNFPAAYLDSFLEHVARPDSNVVVMTYADLDFAGDVNYEDNYPVERALWQAKVASGEIDPTKVYLFLQHDVDSRPELTMRMLRVQERLGIRSTLMIFNKSINRSVLEQEKRIEFVDYDLEMDLLADLTSRGWGVGYHSNALERAGLDFDRAGDFFRQDVTELRQHFDIRFFCPHGGSRTPDGRSNVDYGMPEDMRDEVRWTLNRNTIKFDGVFSDGRWATRVEQQDKIDIRNFVAKWRPGRRYRMLIHPQYYGDPFEAPEAWTDVEWYAEVCRRGLAGEGFADWWPEVSTEVKRRREVPTTAG